VLYRLSNADFAATDLAVEMPLSHRGEIGGDGGLACVEPEARGRQDRGGRASLY